MELILQKFLLLQQVRKKAPNSRSSGVSIVRLKPDGTRWCSGGEVKGKVANGVGSQYSHTPSECGVSTITTADAHNSAHGDAQEGKWRENWRME